MLGFAIGVDTFSDPWYDGSTQGINPTQKKDTTMSYAVLSDDDTFDGVDNVMIYRLDNQGDDTLFDTGRFKSVDDANIVDSVSLSDLLALWNETHGTDF